MSVRSPEELEAALRAIGDAYYHHRHPFNLRMHDGTLTRQELQTWVANRYYYQTRIPIKDGMILSKSPDPEFRRDWVGRIHDHDGRAPGEGGLELWLVLAEAVGLERASVESLEDVLPGVRRACDAYVEFVESHDLLESVASSLTEKFAGDIMVVRIAAFEKHYPWIGEEGLRYFRSRTVQAPRDAEKGLAYVTEHATTEALQDQCLAAVRRKCEILWSLLDAVEAAHDRPRLSPHAQLRDDPEADTLVVLPERAVKIGGSGAEILSLCDGQQMTCEIAAAFRTRHPDAPSAADDVHDFIDEMRTAGVLDVDGAS